MSWGSCFFYYLCPTCGKKYKYDADLIGTLGPRFGVCPVCGGESAPVKDGPRGADDPEYEETE